MKASWATRHVFLAVLLPVLYAHAQGPSAGGPEAIPRIPVVDPPHPNATPTPRGGGPSSCPQDGFKYDALTNSCKECLYMVSGFKSSLIRDNATGTLYGRWGSDNHNQLLTLGPDDVVLGQGTPDSSAAFSSISSFLQNSIDLCYAPDPNGDPNDPWTTGFNTQFSQCVEYRAERQYLRDIQQESDWLKPHDPDYSYAFHPPSGHHFHFGHITKIFVPGPNGDLIQVDTPAGISFEDQFHPGLSAFFDKEGNRLNPNDIIDFTAGNADIWRTRTPAIRSDINKILCYSWDVVGIASPVSLLLPDCDYRTLEPTIAHFSLDPDRPDAYSIWKASSCMPLLVTDPDTSGAITGPHQLIGDWTRGGAPDVGKKKRKWKHGFQALSSFDKDADGVIRGEELGTLYLWSDANKNGVSDAGEVSPVDQFGISELRYRKPQPHTNGDLFIEDGYTLSKSGKTSKGFLIDWYGRVARSPQQLKPFLPTNAVLSPNSPSHQLKSVCRKEDTRTAAGGWRWYMENDSSKTTRGFLTLGSDPKGALKGNSFALTSIQKKNTPLSLMFSAWPLEAQKTPDGYTFTVTTTQGLVESVVSLAADGMSLTGKTTYTSGSGQGGSYSWKADRVGCSDNTTT